MAAPKDAIGSPHRHSYWSDAEIRARGGDPRHADNSDGNVRAGKK